MSVLDDLFDDPTDEPEARGGYEESSFGDVTVVKETKAAILVKFPNRSKPHWVPRSQIKNGRGWSQGDKGVLVVTEWLVEKWAEEGFDPDKESEEESVSLPDCVCLKETDSAIWVKVQDQRIWFPKSHVLPASEVSGDGDVGVLVVSKWIATQKSLSARSGRSTTTAQDDLANDSKQESLCRDSAWLGQEDLSCHDPEIAGALRTSGGDIGKAARSLGMSIEGMQRRIREDRRRQGKSPTDKLPF